MFAFIWTHFIVLLKITAERLELISFCKLIVYPPRIPANGIFLYDYHLRICNSFKLPVQSSLEFIPILNSHNSSDSSEADFYFCFISKISTALILWITHQLCDVKCFAINGPRNMRRCQPNSAAMSYRLCCHLFLKCACVCQLCMISANPFRTTIKKKKKNPNRAYVRYYV